MNGPGEDSSDFEYHELANTNRLGAGAEAYVAYDAGELCVESLSLSPRATLVSAKEHARVACTLY